MIDKFERLSHKPTRFGEANLMTALESGMALEQGTMCGVNILTDSSELAASIRITPDNTVNVSDQLNLIYLTGTPLPFFDSNKPLVAPMDPEFAGEIYTDYSLKTFGFSGIPSFGTMSHIVYGIRSIDNVQKDILGLHAAVIHDRQIDACHLLVGPTKSGKSTLGKELERFNPERFTLLGDDWADVDMVTGDIKVVSPVFSPSTPDPDQSPLFVSFKKPYYGRPEFGEINQGGMRMATVIELHPEHGLNRQSFVRKSMSAIPFIISDDFNSLKIDRLHRGTAHSHLVQLFQYRIGHYRNMYDRLLSDRGLPSIINDRSEGVEGLTRQIYNQITR